MFNFVKKIVFPESMRISLKIISLSCVCVAFSSRAFKCCSVSLVKRLASAVKIIVNESDLHKENLRQIRFTRFEIPPFLMYLL